MTIKEIRSALGLSQAQFAKLTGIPKGTICHWEQGNREPPEYVTAMLEKLYIREKSNGTLSWIKVNLPASEDAYILGNGEGVFALAEPDAKHAYDTDEENTVYTVTLDNDSCYYPKLKHGALIPIEMRGKNRPVVPYEWLAENYGNKEEER